MNASLICSSTISSIGGQTRLPRLASAAGIASRLFFRTRSNCLRPTGPEMPVVDGWEATRRLKGSPQTRDIPIIALSAHALAGEREKALAAGCNEFDTKPIEFDRLVATVRRILADLK